MAGFVGCDFGLVLQGQSDVIEAFEQAVAGELVNLEGGGESVSSWTLHCSRSMASW